MAGMKKKKYIVKKSIKCFEGLFPKPNKIVKKHLNTGCY